MKKIIRYALLIVIFMLPIWLFYSCYHVLTCAEKEEFVSPEGKTTIIVQYDLVCRPTVYRKEWWGKKKVWEYSGSGFMETVHFGVEWLSEEEICLTYDDIDDEFDEEYRIRIRSR